ncbi:MAG TPA: type III-A CRISPR-associated RAMP protein Csm5, partial [Methanothrix sp.]
MRYRLHVITPVHVGNGTRLGRMDYVRRGDRLFVIDLQKLAALPGIDPEELSDLMYASEFNIGEFLQRNKVNPASVAAYTLDCRCNPQGDLLASIKDGNRLAYIPGSSIKGALRTAILWERIKNSRDKRDAISAVRSVLETSDSRRKRAQAAKPLERLLLGKDPNHDHLRALRVSDSDPIPLGSLEIVNVELLSL